MARARDPVGVKLDAQTVHYCHVVHFPLGWQELDPNSYPRPIGYTGPIQDPPNYDFGNGLYEFRVPVTTNLPGTRFW